MKLIVFDIDGTLTDTNQVDGISFLEAWKIAYKISDLSTIWSDYEHSTDSGILEEVFTKRLGRQADEKDRRHFITTFVKILRGYTFSKPDLFSEVPGAKQILRQLKSSGFAVSIATGAWKESGLLKLKTAGVWTEEIPFASAEDAFSRADILRTSIARASDFYQSPKFESVTYVGDGIWDWKASQEIGVKFIGRSDRGSLVGRIPSEILLLTDYLGKGSHHFHI